MNRDLINSRYFPSNVITVYADHQKRNFYLENRAVQNINGKLRLMTASPLAEKVIKDIAATYIENKTVVMAFDSIIPDYILYALNKPGIVVVIWYRPAMERVLNFNNSVGIKGKTQKAHVPATLYAIVNSKLYTFALQDNDRPGLSTKLYKAPFLNIYEDGNVCLGSANVGRLSKTFEGEADRFERGFYMAEQNGGMAQQCKTDLKTLWTSLIKSQKPFPSKTELVQHKKFKTLGDLTSNLLAHAIK